MLGIDTFELKEHDPGYLSTVRIPLNHVKEADCPRFRQFISEVTLGDEPLASLNNFCLNYFYVVDLACLIIHIL